MVRKGTHACNGFELLIETSKVVETTFKTNLLDGHGRVDEQLTGISYPYFEQKLRVRFARSVFKIAAKRVRREPRQRRNFLQFYLVMKVLEGIFINTVQSFIFKVGGVVLKTKGR